MKKNLNITINEAMSYLYGLNSFIEKDIALPKQLSWDIDCNIDKLQEVANRFYKNRNKVMKVLIDQKKAFISSETGEFTSIPKYEEEFDAAMKEISEYANIVIDLEIRVDSFELLPDAISAKDYRALRFMIEQPLE